MRIEITVDGERVYVWRSGFEVLVAVFIATDVLHIAWCIVDLLTWPPAPATWARIVVYVVWIAICLCGYAWLRRRNFRQSART